MKYFRTHKFPLVCSMENGKDSVLDERLRPLINMSLDACHCEEFVATHDLNQGFDAIYGIDHRSNFVFDEVVLHHSLVLQMRALQQGAHLPERII